MKKERFLLFSTIFSYLMLDFYVKSRIRFSLRDKRLFEITEVEITRVDCSYIMVCPPVRVDIFLMQTDKPWYNYYLNHAVVIAFLSCSWKYLRIINIINGISSLVPPPHPTPSLSLCLYKSSTPSTQTPSPSERFCVFRTHN